MPQLGGMWVAGDNKNLPWWSHVVRWLFIAVAVIISAHTSFGGISYSGPDSLGSHGLVTLALAVLLLNIFNMVLKPLLVIFTLPFVLLTLGLGLWIINAFLFLLVAKIVPGFVVADFWHALWGAFLVSVASFFANRRLALWRLKVTRVIGGVSKQQPSARRDDDVIDV